MKQLVLFAIFLFAAAQPAHAGTCDAKNNPHSFDCAEDTFRGKLFPVRQMSSELVQGPWVLLTYSAIDDKPGPEFKVLVNEQNPHIPEGVVNRADGSKAGLLDWTIGSIRMLNWGRAGFTLNEKQGTHLNDQFTVETILQNGSAEQGFQCRVFIRNNNDHLLCRWFTVTNGNQVSFRGYLGFLRSN